MSDDSPAVDADRLLADAYRDFTPQELRWDWCCNLPHPLRQILLNELRRREISFKEFDKLGRGIRRGNP